MSVEAMKQALEALDKRINGNFDGKPYSSIEYVASLALREAIEQAEKQEPVYAYRRKGMDYFCTCDESRYLELSQKPEHFEVTILYTAPRQHINLCGND